MQSLTHLAAAALLAQAAPAPEHPIYKSADRGVTWVKAGHNLAGNPRINSFGATADRVFAGTDTGIYSSDDEGRTWRKTAVTARTICFATSQGTLYAGTQTTGLLASHDQGLTWNSITSLASRNIRSLLAGEEKLIAGTDADGVMVSSDHGMTWVAHNAGLPSYSQIFALARIEGTVFAGLYAKGLYSWRKNDSRWTEVGNIKPLVLAATSGTLIAGHNPGGIYWSQKPKSREWTKATGSFGSPEPVWEMASGNGLVLAGVADGIFRSDDGGRTWSRASRGLPAGSPAVSFLVRGDTVFAGLLVTQESGKIQRR